MWEGQVSDTAQMLGIARDRYNIGALLRKRKKGKNDSLHILTFVRCHYMHPCPFDELHFLEEMVLSSLQGQVTNSL